VSPAQGRLDGKVALITGAAGDMGAAISRLFAEEGAELLLTDTDDAGAGRLAAEIGGAARAHPHDVTSEEDWEAVTAWALEGEGRVDVLVNNAGVFLAAGMADTSLEAFRHVQEVNQVGVFLGMRTIAPAMAERGSGSIINLSSVAGLIGSPFLIAYGASKWAVRGMTKCAAKELARTGVRVNSLHPGQIDSDMNTRQRERTPELVDRLIAAIPMKRLGDPEEIAEAAVYMASDESRYMTGGEVVVDGGATA
jgi:3alpha(or 20beta)-hydroxysteroid dehydrogenase